VACRCVTKRTDTVRLIKMEVIMNLKENVVADKTQVESKKSYESPCIVEETEMTFTKEVWTEFCTGKWCFGCSNCSCR